VPSIASFTYFSLFVNCMPSCIPCSCSGCGTQTLRVVVRPLDQLRTAVPADQAGVAPTGPVTFKWV
jgi:hypothetical protein